MKILYALKMYNNPMYEWQRVHIFNELEHHGIQIDLFNPLEYLEFDEMNKKLIESAGRSEYSLFMTAHNEEVVTVETLQKIEKMGIPTLLICFDNLLVPYVHRKVAKYYDLVWLTSSENKNLFLKWGANTIVMPYAANPFFFKPYKGNHIKKRSFIGSPYGSRANTINKLIADRVAVDLYANKKNASALKDENRKISRLFTKSFIYSRYPVGRKLMAAAMLQKFNTQAILNEQSDNLCRFDSPSFADMARLYSEYRLSFSSTTARNTGILKNPVEIVNLRSFEIPMSGGIQFCHYASELAQYFTEDKEIVFYRNDKELIEKARHYLYTVTDEEISRLKGNARRRALSDHTWYARFSKIFQILHISTPIQ